MSDTKVGQVRRVRGGDRLVAAEECVESIRRSALLLQQPLQPRIPPRQREGSGAVGLWRSTYLAALRQRGGESWCYDAAGVVLKCLVKVRGWGDNRKGQLGRGKEEAVLSPGTIVLDPHCWRDMSIGQVLSEGWRRKVAGHVFACGDNSYGQLGLPFVVNPRSSEIERPISTSQDKAGPGADAGAGDFIKMLVQIRLGRRSPGMLDNRSHQLKNQIRTPVEVGHP
eukprot:278317-Hanusia_phi.AAC.1